ncbi:hypothetical protein IAU60_005879 [Kwoniella sp. DSM 27419]
MLQRTSGGSFADANGDGIGDLKGIISKVPYLESLGVDAIWMSPFYPSALKDGGYPKIGTLEDFDEMVAALKRVNIKVMVDIVPNHSSDDHEWFQQAVKAGKGSPERERYIFRDGANDGQWYFHLFDSSQPDFNWDHPDVKEDFIKTLRFWGDRGVAGFRIDVAHALTKDWTEPLPKWADLVKLTHQKLRNGNADLKHPILDRDATQEIYKAWRKVFNEYDPPLMAVAESWVAPDRKYLYASPEGLGQAFSFDILLCNFSAKEYQHCIQHSLETSKATGSSTTWVLSNHDVVRHASRYGMPDIETNENHGVWTQITYGWLQHRFTKPAVDLAQGIRRGQAATLMLLGLPGSTYIYHDAERQDPTFFRTHGAEIGRDGCRVPIPWEAKGEHFGYGGKPHLPQPEWFGKYAVDVEDADRESTLWMYRQAMRLRKQLQGEETLEWVSQSSPDVLHYKRPDGWEVVLNAGKTAIDIPTGKVLLTSGLPVVDGKLAGETTAWLKVD